MYRYLKVYQGSVNKGTSFTILTIFIIYVTFVYLGNIPFSSSILTLLVIHVKILQ